MAPPKRWLRRRFPPRRRTPTVLQMEATECGAAALGIILGYHGRFEPLASLRAACGVSRDGSKASNLIKAARRYGLQAKGFKKSLAKAMELEPPFIVFWNFNHFLVVEGFAPEQVHLNDPATGPRIVSTKEFDEAFTGVALVMSPGPDFVRAGAPPRVWPALRRRLRGNWGALAYCGLAGLLLALLGVIVPGFTQVFIDAILLEGMEHWLRPLVATMLAAAVLLVLIRQLQLRVLRRLRLRLSVMLTSEFLWHLLRLPASFYDQRYSGEIANRVQLNERIADLLASRISATAIGLVMGLLYAAAMFSFDVPLAGLAVAFALANGLALQWVARSRRDLSLRLQQDIGRAAGVAVAGLRRIETIKAGASEDAFFERWAGHYTKASNARHELALLGMHLGVVPTALTSLTTLALLGYGGLRVIDGQLSVGMLIALHMLLQGLQAPVGQAVGLATQLQELHGDLARLDDVLAHSPDDSQSADEALDGAGPPRLRGELRLAEVSFGYSPVSPPVLQEFSLTVTPGRRVALVGSSGSGKSTIARLVVGTYPPWSGEVRFDGHLRSQLPAEVFQSSVSLIDQEAFLFAGSVRENLTLWDETVPLADLVRACKDAEIHEAILRLPGGYDARLLEGASNLSGGQRQRLEIARGLVTNPSLIVLDEATSALDPVIEERIDRNLRQRGCTCLIIAHRLSTIRDADEIVVLEQGRIIERGTHEDLFARGGAYARLIESESGR